MSGELADSTEGTERYWHLVISTLGGLLLVTGATKAAVEISNGGGLLEATLDLILLSSPGLVMLYIGRWLPTASIDPKLYLRIVGWVFRGIAVMGVVLWLRVIHPGVDVQFTFGTQAVLLSIGSIAGLGGGIHEAIAFTHANTLETQNEKLRRAEREREEAVKQLEASNERLEQFAYAASHDLQEPLRMVTRYLELAERRFGEDLNEDCKEFMTFAVDGAERMSGMIDGLLDYSRVTTQGDPFEPVDLNDVLDDVLVDLQFKLEVTDAELTREPLPLVRGDERQLHQLFQNLLSNAIQYSGDEPPRIHVAAEDAVGTDPVVSVRDDGIRIEPGDEDRIFDIFQRLHSMDEHENRGLVWRSACASSSATRGTSGSTPTPARGRRSPSPSRTGPRGRQPPTPPDRSDADRNWQPLEQWATGTSTEYRRSDVDGASGTILLNDSRENFSRYP